MNPSAPLFRMPFAEDGSGFGALTLEVKLHDSDALLPLAGVEGKAENDILVFQSPYFSSGQTQAQIYGYLNPNLDEASFLNSTHKPVPCIITLRPLQAADGTRFQAGEVQKECAVKISDVMIEWDTEPAGFKRDGAIYIPADGKTKVQLICRAKRLVPGRVIDDDRGIYFTHKIQKVSFAPPVREAFFITEQPQQGSRQDHTEWQSMMALPNRQRPDIKLPAQCRIRVRAWAPGADIQRSDWAIDARGGAMKDQIYVPVFLTESKLAVEIVEPAMPIPAKGEPVTVTLQVWSETEDENGAVVRRPALDQEIQWEPVDERPAIASVFDRKSGKTDGEGKIAFQYTPPEMYYYRGGRYYEDLEVSSGSGPGGSKIGKVRLLLAPNFKFKIGGKKQETIDTIELGLTFDEQEVLVGAEQFVREIKGKFEVGDINPVTDEDVSYGVAWADVLISTFNGTDFVPLATGGKQPMQTDLPGNFTWTFPELASHYGSGPNQQAGQVYALDPDNDELPEIRMNDPSSAELKEYEDKIDQFYPDDILPADLNDKIHAYRVVFLEHLAKIKAIDYKLALSAIRLMKTAATYADLFYKLYKDQAGRVWDELKNFAVELIGLLWNMSGIAGKIVGWVGDMAQAALSATRQWVTTRMLPWVLGKTLPRLTALGHYLLEKIEELVARLAGHSTWLSQAWTRVRSAVQQFLTYAGQFMSDESSGANPNLLGALLSRVGGFLMEAIHMVVHAVGFCVCFVFELLCRGAAEFVRWLGTLMVRISPAAVEWLERQISAAMGTNLRYPLGTALEKAVDALASEAAGLLWGEGIEPAIDRRAANSSLTQKLNIYPGFCAGALEADYKLAREPGVPLDYDERQKALRNFAVSMRDKWHSLEKGNIYLDLAKDLLDISITLAQIVTVCLLVVFAPELLPAAGDACTEAENLVRAFKTVAINLPQFAFNLGCTMGIACGTTMALFDFMHP